MNAGNMNMNVQQPNNVQSQGNGANTGFRPGVPMTEIVNGGRGSSLEQMNQANQIVERTLFGGDVSQPSYTQPVNNTYANPAYQENTQPNNSLLLKAANVLLEQEATRKAQESLPSFLRSSTPNGYGSNNAGVNVGNAQANNQQQNGSLPGVVVPNSNNNPNAFGSNGVNTNTNTNANTNTNPNANSSGTTSNWWDDAFGIKSEVNTQGAQLNNQQASQQNVNNNQPVNNANTYNTNTNHSSVPNQMSEAQKYSEDLSSYNTRMFATAMAEGVDIEQFKQVASSMTPEESARLVIEKIRASNVQHNSNPAYNGNGGINNGSNGYMPNNQGHPNASYNNQQTTQLPQQTQMQAQPGISIAGIPAGTNISATGRNNIYHRGLSYGSES